MKEISNSFLEHHSTNLINSSSLKPFNKTVFIFTLIPVFLTSKIPSKTFLRLPLLKEYFSGIKLSKETFILLIPFDIFDPRIC